MPHDMRAILRFFSVKLTNFFHELKWLIFGGRCVVCKYLPNTCFYIDFRRRWNQQSELLIVFCSKLIHTWALIEKTLLLMTVIFHETNLECACIYTFAGICVWNELSSFVFHRCGDESQWCYGHRILEWHKAHGIYRNISKHRSKY